MDNLDSFLFPVNSPVSQNQGQTSGYAFDYENEAGVISTAKIRNASIGTAQVGSISFNQIAGGTAILGGTVNGNGFLSVKNSSGSEIVRADNAGLTVTNGSINIQNSSGTSIIDSSGLISSANFTTNVSTDSNTNSTTSTYFVNMGAANVSFVTSNPDTLVLLTASFDGYVTDSSASRQGVTYFEIDGSEYDPTNDRFYFQGLVNNTYSSYTKITVASILSAGNHTARLKVASQNGTVTVHWARVRIISINLGV